MTGGKTTMTQQKFSFKNILKLIAAFGGLVLIIFLVFQLTNKPITVAAANQVYAALEAQGCTPENTTAKLKESNSSIVESISVERDDFKFYFHSFSDDKNALQISQKYRSYLRDNRYHVQYNVETEDNMANYSIYTLTVNNEYTVCARIGNSVIYAESSENDSNIIKNVMKEIGYFKD